MAQKKRTVTVSKTATASAPKAPKPPASATGPRGTPSTNASARAQAVHAALRAGESPRRKPSVAVPKGTFAKVKAAGAKRKK